MSGWDDARRINESDWPRNVKALAHALRQWRNSKTGEVRPAVSTIARAMGLSASTVRTYINQAIACGALELSGSRSGGRRPTTYRLNLPPANPPKSGGLSGSHHTPNPPESVAHPAGFWSPTRRNPAGTPPKSGDEQPREQPMNNTNEQAVAVLARLGLERLRSNPNATPDRLAWIEREAHTKKSPAGWARACIEEGWNLPEASEADQAAAKQAERDRRLAAFDAMPDDQRREVLQTVRRKFPNLSDCADDHYAVRGAVLKVMAERERADSGCTIRTNGVA